MPSIWKAPSPVRPMTGRFGCANFALIAYGTPGTMVASVPDSDPRMPSRSMQWRAYQFVADPLSEVMITSSGSRRLSSQNTSSGLTGSASWCARSSSTRRQASTSLSMVSRQDRSTFGSSIGSRAVRVSLASPTSETSLG